MDQAERTRLGSRATAVGIAVSVFFCVVKVVFGHLTGVLSLIVDGCHNLTDAAASLVTLLGFRLASRPADPEHPFGHGRIEYLSGLAVAVCILILGLELLKTSVLKVMHPEPLALTALTLAIPTVSIVAQFLLARHYESVAARIDSTSLRAAALDCRADCWSTVAVIAGMVVYGAFGLNVDGWAGVIVALLILSSGYKAARDTIQPLLGEPPDPALVEGIKALVLATPPVSGVHDLIVHTYGPGRHFASLHAELPADVPIMAAHVVIDGLEQEIARKFGIAVTIHMDPLAHDEETTELRQSVDLLVRAIDSRLSTHDFRMVHAAHGARNLIFDVVVPYQVGLSDDGLRVLIGERLAAAHPLDRAIVHFDRQYC